MIWAPRRLLTTDEAMEPVSPVFTLLSIASTIVHRRLRSSRVVSGLQTYAFAGLDAEILYWKYVSEPDRPLTTSHIVMMVLPNCIPTVIIW
jgi:hypothetical protein